MRIHGRWLCEGAHALLVVIGLVGGAASPARAQDAEITAVIDQARLIRIPKGTETLIIGNPTIADVTLLKQNNLMILSPRSFGETNFIALDRQGNPVAQSTIRVIAGSDALIVQSGMARQSYSCSPRCQPTERLGDDNDYLTKVSKEDQEHASRLTNTGAPTAPALLSPMR